MYLYNYFLIWGCLTDIKGRVSEDSKWNLLKTKTFSGLDFHGQHDQMVGRQMDVKLCPKTI